MSKLVDLASHGKYKPDLVGLACGKVAATRALLGLSHEELSVELSRLLTWTTPPDIIASWERQAAAPPGDVLAACDVLAARNAGLTRIPPQPDREGLDGFPVPQQVMDAVASAADEADDQQVELLAVAPEIVTSLWDDMTVVARRPNRTPWATFSASQRVRSLALKVANQTRRPACLLDLYLVAGVASALMASTAFDLHCWEDSDRLARSAISYADLVGNNSLRTWTLSLSALLANWRNEPDIALQHFSEALETAPSGTPKFRLRYIAARSYALLGDARGVRTLLEQANDDRDDTNGYRDLLSEEVGGEFAFDSARAEACAAAAWLDLSEGQEAREAAQRALTELTALAPGRQPISQTLGTRVDLATAHIISGDLDEAHKIVREAITAGANMQNASLAGRLSRTRSVLVSSSRGHTAIARDLDEGIEELLSPGSEP